MTQKNAIKIFEEKRYVLFGTMKPKHGIFPSSM